MKAICSCEVRALISPLTHPTSWPSSNEILYACFVFYIASKFLGTKIWESVCGGMISRNLKPE